MRLFKLFAAVMISGVLLTGCGGGGAELHSTNTTMGQELMDLDAAYKKGIMTEDEYKDAKEKIIDRYD